jgi:hypothetical protein
MVQAMVLTSSEPLATPRGVTLLQQSACTIEPFGSWQVDRVQVHDAARNGVASTTLCDADSSDMMTSSPPNYKFA